MRSVIRARYDRKPGQKNKTIIFCPVSLEYSYILILHQVCMQQRPPFSSGNSYIYHWERKHGGSLLLPVAEADMRET